jgi:hypothetical protein
LEGTRKSEPIDPRLRAAEEAYAKSKAGAKEGDGKSKQSGGHAHTVIHTQQHEQHCSIEQTAAADGVDGADGADGAVNGAANGDDFAHAVVSFDEFYPSNGLFILRWPTMVFDWNRWAEHIHIEWVEHLHRLDTCGTALLILHC